VTTPGERTPQGKKQEAARLARERAERRAARDFAAADALRERIAALGFTVTDTADGYELRRVPVPAVRRITPAEVPSALRDPPDHDATVHWLAEDWPEDVLRGIASFRAPAPARSVQHVVVESVPAEVEWPERVEVLRLREDPGWARARNAGLPRTRGMIAVIADGSIEATGDWLGPLEGALANPTVGVTGPFGLVTEELHEFVPSPGPECDAIEAYVLAVRRELLETGLAFDPRFRFYRSADIDLSFRVKDRGLRATVTPLPLVQHEHRRWWSTPPEVRRKLSKRNYYRFLDRWRGRTDLTVAGTATPGTG